MSAFLLYGATGYTGSLVARLSVSRGLTPILAGRDASKLAKLGAELGAEYVVGSLQQPAALAALLKRAPVVLNAAGPFSATLPALLREALHAGVHYLDLCGEVEALAFASRCHAEARERRVMVMPGVGFDVVPSDCLAVHLARRLGGMRRLSIVLLGMGAPSRGSFLAMTEGMGRAVQVRRGGVLAPLAPGDGERRFELGHETIAALPISWGDVVTAAFSTGAEDVTTYFEATPAVRAMLGLCRVARATGTAAYGAEAARAFAPLLGAPEPGGRVRIVAEAEGPRGRARAVLETPEVYSTTADAAVSVLERVVAGDLEPGFQTPGRIYGPDFALLLPGVVREDL